MASALRYPAPHLERQRRGQGRRRRAKGSYRRAIPESRQRDMHWAAVLLGSYGASRCLVRSPCRRSPRCDLPAVSVCSGCRIACGRRTRQIHRIRSTGARRLCSSAQRQRAIPRTQRPTTSIASTMGVALSQPDIRRTTEIVWQLSDVKARSTAVVVVLSAIRVRERAVCARKARVCSVHSLGRVIHREPPVPIRVYFQHGCWIPVALA